MEVEDIINYRKLSELLGLSPESIRKNKVPKKHKEKIEQLNLVLKVWHTQIKESNQTKKK